MVDLHIHSIHSDGSSTVKMILENAQNLGLEAISITDHNSIGAYNEIEEYEHLKRIYKGKMITGIELLATYKNNFIEILGYGFDKDKLKIKHVDERKKELDALKHLITVANALGIKIDSEIKLEESGKESIAYYQFIKELIKTENYQSIFPVCNDPVTMFYYNHYSNQESPFYFDEFSYYDTASDVIDKIHSSGGLASLAHPYLYPSKNKEEFIEELVSILQIDIIECIYPKFSQTERNFLQNLCKKYNKMISGGSDYHGLNRPKTKLGTGINYNLNIPFEIIKPWINSQKNVLSLKK